MAYQTTTKTSYGQRVGNSFRGILTGIILFVGATVLLWWNEGRAVKTDKMLKQAEGQAVHVESVAAMDHSYEGKLIHATAMAETSEHLTDPMNAIDVVAIRLDRNVEYYQWVEHSNTETKDKFGGGQETTTTYTCERKWTDNPIDSDKFNDPKYRGKNTVNEQIEEASQLASDVKFGAYTLPPFLVSQIPGDTPVEVPVKDTTAYKHVTGNTIYYGANQYRPQIGDVRVTYTMAEPQEVSVMAVVSGATFDKFVAKNGYSLALLQAGEVSMEDMFQQEHDTNKTLLWVFRLVGLLLVFFGLKGIVEIVITILKVIPFVANIVNLAAGIVLAVVAFAWTMLVIAIAWLFYRPLLGILLLALGIGALVFFAGKGKKSEANA